MEKGSLPIGSLADSRRNEAIQKERVVATTLATTLGASSLKPKGFHKRRNNTNQQDYYPKVRNKLN